MVVGKIAISGIIETVTQIPTSIEADMNS
jgi:hypothetical protein